MLEGGSSCAWLISKTARGWKVNLFRFSFRQPHSCHQLLIPRVVPQRVYSGIHPEPAHSIRSLPIGSLQRLEGFVLFSQGGIDGSQVETTHVARVLGRRQTIHDVLRIQPVA
jgi:hypothetical protein